MKKLFTVTVFAVSCYVSAAELVHLKGKDLSLNKSVHLDSVKTEYDPYCDRSSCHRPLYATVSDVEIIVENPEVLNISDVDLKIKLEGEDLAVISDNPMVSFLYKSETVRRDVFSRFPLIDKVKLNQVLTVRPYLSSQITHDLSIRGLVIKGSRLCIAKSAGENLQPVDHFVRVQVKSGIRYKEKLLGNISEMKSYTVFTDNTGTKHCVELSEEMDSVKGKRIHVFATAFYSQGELLSWSGLGNTRGEYFVINY